MSAASVPKDVRQFIERESSRPDLARATRATAGFMIPLVLQATVGLPVSVVFASLAAQNIAMLDVRGDYRLRLLLLLGLIALLTSAGALGAAASGHIALAVAATMVVSAGAALWRHLGSDYGIPLSASSMLLFLISLATATSAEDVVPHVKGILLGGAIGLVLQIVLWPFRAQHPLRRAASDSWIAAGNLFDALQPGRPATAFTTAEHDLRSTLDQTHRLLAGASRNRHNALPDQLEALSLRAARLSVRVVAVHTALDGLVGTPAHERLAPSLGTVLTSLTNSARSIAVAVVSRQPTHLATCEVRLRRLSALLETQRARLTGAPAPADADQLATLLERVQATVPEMLEALRATLDRASERALFAVELTDVQTWQLKPLATALNFSRKIDPSLVRFGARLAVCTGLATLIYRWFDIPHGYWLPFTVVVVMQPDYGSTRRKAAQRVGGTLAGSLVASGLIWLPLGPTLHQIAIALGVFGFAHQLKRNYGRAVFCATIFVVLLLEHTGESGGSSIELERIGATLGGGLIALTAALLFWPVWEHDRFAPVLAGALHSTRDYLAQLQRRLQTGGALDEPTVAAKRRAEAASAAVFSSLGRLFADAHNPRVEIERSATLANGNQRTLRFANLLMVSLHEGPATPSPGREHYFDGLSLALEALTRHALAASPETLASLQATATTLDTLPALAEAGGTDALVLNHLARLATEVRAMLATALTALPATGTTLSKASQATI